MSVLDKIPAYIIKTKGPIRRWEAFLEFIWNTKDNPVFPDFSTEEMREAQELLNGNLSMNSKNKWNQTSFEGIVFDFDNQCIVLWIETKQKISYKKIPNWRNSTYTKKALCILFAVLSIYKEQSAKEISMDAEDYLEYVADAYKHIFWKEKMKGKTNDELISRGGPEIKGTFSYVKQIADFSWCWKFTRRDDIIKVEKTH